MVLGAWRRMRADGEVSRPREREEMLGKTRLAEGLDWWKLGLCAKSGLKRSDFDWRLEIGERGGLTVAAATSDANPCTQSHGTLQQPGAAEAREGYAESPSLRVCGEGASESPNLIGSRFKVLVP